MLGKRARGAWAGRWPEPIETTPRGWYHRTEEGAAAAAAAAAAAVVPASPLERDVRSPKGWMNRVSAGVGLGIVAALERTGGRGDVAAKAAVGTSATGTSTRAAVSWKGGWWSSGVAGTQKSSLGGLFCGVDEDDDDGFHYRILSSSSSVSSPLRLPPVGLPFFPPADFLSSCYLCKKKLHGGDIYMYRGEKAFCSMECRGRQMVAEQLQENCSSEASKPPSDYAAGGLFCTGSAPA